MRTRARQGFTRRLQHTVFSIVLVGTATVNAQELPELHGKWYVDDTAPPAGDGLDWPTAFTNLQDALAASAADMAPEGERNEIWVAAGAGNRPRRTITRHGHPPAPFAAPWSVPAPG